ncbi:DinB family protein [Peribacillus muralis]|uniref:DinB family protein n=1 Tax=Peribacillus muralis TaxID=264697 RepID=UPI001F4EF9B5|nr:DinB family protein [Peribacillus muralis]MCK1991923.1 DinB family protein [Peribacillus muralis]MCK2012481.1 DinB family protein [Peribacillus muralis]
MDFIEYDLLFESRNQLIGEISELDDKTLDHRPAPDVWSIAQICHHLYLTEQVFTDVIAHGIRERDYTNIIQKNIYLVSDRTKKFASPDSLSPSSSPFPLSNIMDLLAESRDRLFQVLYEMDADTRLDKKKAKHPLFGDLSLDQWIELLSLHEQRHIKQIQEIKSALI